MIDTRVSTWSLKRTLLYEIKILNNETKKFFANTAATQKFERCGNNEQNLLPFTPFGSSPLALKAIIM
jgi:hypothetical protein